MDKEKDQKAKFTRTWALKGLGKKKKPTKRLRKEKTENQIREFQERDTYQCQACRK